MAQIHPTLYFHQYVLPIFHRTRLNVLAQDRAKSDTPAFGVYRARHGPKSAAIILLPILTSNLSSCTHAHTCPVPCQVRYPKLSGCTGHGMAPKRQTLYLYQSDLLTCHRASLHVPAQYRTKSDTPSFRGPQGTAWPKNNSI